MYLMISKLIESFNYDPDRINCVHPDKAPC